MKITMVLPSRNRPAGLLSVLTSLDAMATGMHEITYALIVDDDDQATQQMLKAGYLPQNTRIFSAPRGRTVNARFNGAVRECPADAYSQVCDDAHPLTLHWDAIFNTAAKLPAFGWLEKNDPTNYTYPVLSSKWVEAVGRFYPEYFPFWFADTWLGEVYMLAFGMPVTLISQLAVGGRRGQTQGMRDLRFWFEFFAATRQERIAEAQRVSEAFGIEAAAADAALIAQMEAKDAWQLTQIPRYEAVFKADQGEPSETYLNAKEVAEQWLAARAMLEAA